MNTDFLESFVQIAELGSIAEAARQLDLTPTAVALRIKALEDEVGTALLERAGRTVRLSPAGMKVLQQAKLILHEVKNFSSLASNTELPAGPLSLGAVSSVLKGSLPSTLKKWVRQYSSIDILLEPGTSAVLYEKVARRELDAAILVHPLFDIPKSLAWHTLRTEQLVLLTPADMPAPDPLELIRSQPYIRYDRRVVAGKMADDYLRKQGLTPNARLETDGLDHIADLVEAGLGVAVIPLTSGLAQRSALAWHRLPEPLPPVRQIGLVWHRANVREPLVRALIKLL